MNQHGTKKVYTLFTLYITCLYPVYCAGKEPPDSCGYDIPHTAAQMCVGTQQCFSINYSEVGWSVCSNVPEFYAAHRVSPIGTG